jgi:glycosyltransferase involved in cell wall biosynthesis
LSELEKLTTCYRVPLYPSSPLNLIRSIASLRNIVQIEKTDVINTHHRFAALVSNVVSRMTPIPVVSTVHEIKEDRLLFSRLIVGSHVITFSEAVKQNLQHTYRVNPDRIHVVPMGVSVNAPSPTVVSQTKAGLAMPTGLPIVACIARLAEEKGGHIYLQAVAQVLKSGHNAQFLVVGDGPLRETLEAWSQKLGVEKHVLFTGWRDDVYTIIASADFLVLPSRSEGLGMTVLEGLAMAKPSIASNTGGIAEIIRDNETGLLVAPGDPVALAQAIMRFLDEPEFAKWVGQRGQRHLEEHFSLEAMLEKTIGIYKRALDEKSRDQAKQ